MPQPYTMQPLQMAAGRVTEVADSPGGAVGTVAAAEHAAQHETILGLDSHAIVGIAFLVFAVLLWKAGAFRLIGQALDRQAEKVRADLAEAAALRAEAEAVRAKAAAEAKAAEEQAKATLANAEVEAKRILEQAAIDAETQIARHLKLAEDRIDAEARATEAALRRRTATLALGAAESLLKGHVDELGSLADGAIAGLDRT